MSDVISIDAVEDIVITTTSDSAVQVDISEEILDLELSIVGVTGPKGSNGAQGPAGADGSATFPDPGDFTLIFDNHLI